MTRVFTDDGVSVPVTAIQVGPCVVTQLRTPEIDGYAAVQIGYDRCEAAQRSDASDRPRREGRGRAPSVGTWSSGSTRKDLGEYELGKELTVGALEGIAFVDVNRSEQGQGVPGRDEAAQLPRPGGEPRRRA